MNLFKILGISLVAVIAITLISCNCCKKANCSKPNSDGTSDVIMSFVSEASGPDRKSHKAFNDYIAALENKDKKISIEKIAWGREGEKDYCINFLCIKKNEQTKIKTDLKAIAEMSHLTYYKENASCKHKE